MLNGGEDGVSIGDKSGIDHSALLVELLAQQALHDVVVTYDRYLLVDFVVYRQQLLDFPNSFP